MSEDGLFTDTQLFFDTPLYREVNSEAQREFSTDVEPPALTWHMSFVVRKRQNENVKYLYEDLSADVSQDSLHAQMDWSILTLIKGLYSSDKVYSAHLTYDKIDIYPSSRHRFILFDGVYRKLDLISGSIEKIDDANCSPRELEVRRCQSKLVVITFGWSQAGTAHPKDADEAPIKITIRIRLSLNIFSITVIAGFPATRFPGPLNQERFKYLTRTFWETDFVDGFVLELSGVRQVFEHEIFKGIFADMRGVVVPRESCDGYDASLLKSKTTRWANPIVENLRPTVTHGDKYECSSSYMLGGRVLYLTALGPQPLDDEPVGSTSEDYAREPLTFILCVETESEGEKTLDVRQLGHTLDRMHLIATLRHAALLDLNLLRAVSSNLSLIDTTFQEARAMLEVYDAGSRLRADRVRRAIENAHRDLNHITKSFLEGNLAGVGITFRVESSRYYRSQFEENLPALRLERVEGYRPYKHFIDRRLGGAFETIDRLGKRYERATSVLAEIDVRFSAIQARKTGLLVAEIQRYGEFLLLSVLIPYYMMGILHYFFENEKTGIVQIISGHDKKREILPLVIIFLLINFVATMRLVDSSEQLRLDTKIKLSLAIMSLTFLFIGMGVLARSEKWPIEEHTITIPVALLGFIGFSWLLVTRLHRYIRISIESSYKERARWHFADRRVFKALVVSTLSVALFILALAALQSFL